MKSLGHLCTYPVTLRIESPLFIGSGQKLNKKEYLYLRNDNKVLIPDLQKLIRFLDKNHLLDKYQKFLLDPASRNIYNFFRDNGIDRRDYAEFTDYTLDGAGESIVKENLREINLFIKNAQGYPYIPGSSLKGALRTAMLTKLALEDSGLTQVEKKKALAQAWLKAANNNPKNMASETIDWESQLFNCLSFNQEKATDAVNSALRGISVSDSTPLAKEQLTLAQKIDRSTAGKDRILPTTRECLRPGSTCQLTITIDKYIAQETSWTMKAILDAVKKHRSIQQQAFYQHFKGHEQQDVPPGQAVLWLGGGVGFANKTINSVVLGKKNGLELNTLILQKLFPKGHHENDKEIGVAPHMQKMTKYQGQIYRMGQCRLEVEL